MSEVTVNDVRLNVRDRGAGAPTLVFIHGVMCSGALFANQLRSLSSRYRVVAPDLRGHGDSQKVLAGHTVPRYADDLRALFQAIGVERPVLIGWSMGAMVAFEYLKAFGQDQVAGLVIVDQTPSDFAWPDGYEFGMFTPQVLAEAVEHIQNDLAGVASFWADLMLHEPNPDHAALLVGEVTKVPPAIGTSILVDQTLRDYRGFLAEVRVPTLVAFGGDDKATSPEAGRWIADRIRGARLAVFDRSSHCPFLEEPEAFDAELSAFVEGL